MATIKLTNKTRENTKLFLEEVRNALTSITLPDVNVKADDVSVEIKARESSFSTTVAVIDEALKKAGVELQQQIVELTVQEKALEAKIEQQNGEKDKLKSEIAKLRTEKKALEAEKGTIDSLKAENERLKARLENKDGFTNVLVAGTNHILESLKGTDTNVEDLKKSLEDLKSDLEKRGELNDELKTQIDGWISKLSLGSVSDEIKNEIIAGINGISSKITPSEEILKGMRDKITAELEAKYASYVSPEEFAKYSGRADITPEKLIELQRELQETKTALEKEKTKPGGGDPARVAELEGNVRFYIKELDLYQQQIISDQKEVRYLQKREVILKSRKKFLEHQVEELRAELREEKAHGGDAKKIAALEARITDLERENSELQKRPTQERLIAKQGEVDKAKEEAETVGSERDKFKKQRNIFIGTTAAAGTVALVLALGLGIPLAKANNTIADRNKTIGEYEGYFASATDGQGIIIQIMSGETPDADKLALFEASIQKMKEHKNETVKNFGEELDKLLGFAKNIGTSQPGDQTNVKAYLDFIYQIEQMKKVYSDAIADGTVSEEEKAQLQAQISLLNSAEATALNQYNIDSKDNVMVQNKSGEVYAVTYGEQEGITIGSVFATAANYYNLKKDYDELASSGNITPEQLQEVKEKYVGLMFDVSQKLTDLISQANAEGFTGFTPEQLATLKNLSSYTDEIKADFQAKYGESADFATSFGSIVDTIGALANVNAERGVTLTEYVEYLDKITDALVGLYEDDGNGNITLKPVYTLDEDGNVVNSANELVETLKSFEAGLKKAASKNIAAEIENIRKGAGSLQQMQAEYASAVSQINASIKDLDAALKDGVITEAEASEIRAKYQTAISQVATDYVSDFLDVLELVTNLDTTAKAEIERLNAQISEKDEKIKDLEAQIEEQDPENVAALRKQIETLTTEKSNLEAEKTKLQNDYSELKKQKEQLEEELKEHAKSTTFIHAMFDSQIGGDKTGMTEAEIREAIAKQLGLINDELGGDNEGEKDEAQQPGNN